MTARSAIDFVLLAAIWGASFLLMKLGAAEFGPFVTAFLRVFLASLFLLPLLLWQRQMSALRARLRPILLVGMLNSGLPFALYGFAVLHITTGLSAILNATVPLWGALVAWAWLRDRPNGSRMLGLVIGFVGVAALAWDKASFSGVDPMSGLAVLACLMATLLYGISASFTKKYLSNTPAMASAAGSQIGGSLVLLVPAWMTIPNQVPGLHAWVAIILLAFFCTAVAYILFFRLITRLGPARTVTVTFLIPVFGVAYGSVLLGEALSWSMLVFGAVIVLGTALATGVLRLPTSQLRG
jgi:drug/metabolite transporter (DMT)-like permease